MLEIVNVVAQSNIFPSFQIKKDNIDEVVTFLRNNHFIALKVENPKVEASLPEPVVIYAKQDSPLVPLFLDDWVLYKTDNTGRFEDPPELWTVRSESYQKRYKRHWTFQEAQYEYTQTHRDVGPGKGV